METQGQPVEVEKAKRVLLCDRELAVLTGHLLHKYEPQNALQQREMNILFQLLGLDRFETGKVEASDLTTEMKLYRLPYSLLAFIFDVMDRPMLGRIARIIGLNTPFSARLLGAEVPEEAATPPPPEAAPVGAALVETPATPTENAPASLEQPS